MVRLPCFRVIFSPLSLSARSLLPHLTLSSSPYALLCVLFQPSSHTFSFLSRLHRTVSHLDGSLKLLCVPNGTHQRGNWNNFRNETFNGLPFSGRGMEGRWFASNLRKGKVRLDYVSTTRPLPGTKPLSDRRFRQVGCS